MQSTMRWYGPSDPVKLEYIRQVPCVNGIVAAMFEIPVGEVWSLESILERKKLIASHGLEMVVIESIPIHESIKLGTPDREQYIHNYQQSIRNMAAAGVFVLCYNFMPIFDWMRTDLAHQFSDGSTASKLDHDVISSMSLAKGLTRLPAWANDFDAAAMQALGQQYIERGESGLLENLAYFLKAIVPVAESCGVKLALHPDDPPWALFDVPRIVRDSRTIQTILELHPSPNHGITFCTGSLGVNPNNDLVQIIRQCAGRIHFVHARNVKITAPKSFLEVAHPSQYGNVNMYDIISTLVETGFTGAIRSDHGRMIWGETGIAGYGLYDRALGTMYLRGLIEASQRQQVI